jgi:hypothetical protein
VVAVLGAMAANINVDVIAQGKDFHNDFSGSTQTNCDAASGGNPFAPGCPGHGNDKWRMNPATCQMCNTATHFVSAILAAEK